MLETILIWVALFSYLGASLVYGYRFVAQKKRALLLERVLLYGGVACNIVAVAARGFNVGYLPIRIEYESNLFIAALIGVSFLVIRKKMVASVTELLGMVCLPGALLILLGGYVSPAEVKELTPDFFSRWMLVHVIFNMLSVVCLVLATGASLLYLTQKTSPHGIDSFIFRLVLFGFFGWTIMIITGMLWAKDFWGSYWSWDPIEIWSLVSWLAWGIYIHVAFTFGWKGRKLAWLCIICFLTSVISVWGVHYFTPETYHNLQQLRAQ